MNGHGIPYEIVIEFENSVSLGNLPTSTEKMKQFGHRQNRFPKEWTAADNEQAAIELAKTHAGKPKAHEYYTGGINGVSVTHHLREI